MFNRKFFEDLAAEFHKADKNFNSKGFIKFIVKNLDSLELNQRMRHTSQALKEHLSYDYKTSLEIMKKVIPNLKRGYTNLVFPDYVGLYGKNEVALSLEALKYFTKFGSSEFAIREFLREDFDATIQTMYQWAKDEDHHVRRLASEGSRPRLPWSFKLDKVIKDPKLTLPILDQLKKDDELYVRKSVANHLNDIAKEHPDFVVDIIKKWKGVSQQTDWILKHGSRTLLKQGHTEILGHFGIKHSSSIVTLNFKLACKKIRKGEDLTFSFALQNTGNKAVKVRIEYAVYFKVASGNLSKKVFKISEREIQKNETLKFEKKHSFRHITTRKYYPGWQQLSLIINGKESKPLGFELVF